jgi:hypothetical protein
MPTRDSVDATRIRSTITGIRALVTSIEVATETTPLRERGRLDADDPCNVRC